ncbi:hypothetical protein HPG69_003153 [Diceros bicornis minor]|uniref:Schlafen family member 13 n=1 Tax=Diceros bicornis minor TaxID=77932 RepID=A0A7J7EJY0_DICBM|nr:hypothetical protein HPG69_003153 [Diceros bicornis minor]
MQTNHCSLVVEPCYSDLVIDVGDGTLGGGVIRLALANKAEHPVDMGLDLEQCLRALIQSSDLQTFFETKQQGRCFYIFVKSWSGDPLPEDISVKPRVCSLGSSLYCRSGTSVLPMSSRDAFKFLKTKKRDAEDSLINEGSLPRKIPNAKHQILESDPAYQVFQRDRFEYGEILPFPESQVTEFKQFSTKHIQEYLESQIPEYVPAFANTGGGYLVIGVDDKSKQVLGCAKENVDRVSLESAIAGAISKLPVIHFCSSQPALRYETKMIDVFQLEKLYGYLCVVRVEPFCCAVFSKAPSSWLVKDKHVCSLTAGEWVGMRMDTEPELTEAFESQLNQFHRPTSCRPFFPCLVPPGHQQYTPESLWKELSKQHECLEDLIDKQMPRQYEIFSTNLRKKRELFIHGLPGSGKTVMAMKIMEKIRNTFHCEAVEILYICENWPLRNFISNKSICQAVTRKTFMKHNLEKIQHIIIDEAQNFRTEDGDWYRKAKTITQREKDCPGILWIFLDYFQNSRLSCNGLPHFFPKELTRVVHSADPIANYLQKVMQDVRRKPPPNIPPGCLELVHEAKWAQGVPGSFEILRCSNLEEMVVQVAEKCWFFLRNGYSPNDIAVFFSRVSEVEKDEDKFLKAMKKKKESELNDASILASLERTVVFGINPVVAEPAIFNNLLLCLASRAQKHLYILTLSNLKKDLNLRRTDQVFPLSLQFQKRNDYSAS